MKIGNSRAASRTGGSRGPAARGGGSGFAPAGISNARGAAGLSGPASLGAVDALLALQGAAPADDALHAPRRKAVARGEEMRCSPASFQKPSFRACFRSLNGNGVRLPTHICARCSPRSSLGQGWNWPSSVPILKYRVRAVPRAPYSGRFYRYFTGLAG